MLCFYYLHQKVERGIGGVFEKYGRFIARHPWKIVVFIGIMNAALGVGLLKINPESGIDQYVPIGSTASKDQKKVESLFKINTTVNFYVQSLPDLGQFGEVIIELKNGDNILNISNWRHIKELNAYIQNTSIGDSAGNIYSFSDLCARSSGNCVVDGSFLLGSKFILDMNSRNITYPIYNLSTHQTIVLDRFIGNVDVLNGLIRHATALKLRFNLQSESFDLSRQWEEKFVERMALFENTDITVKYSYSDSLSVELSKNVTGDISVFSVTFTLMIVFACLALMGMNCVDNRYFLGLAGILSTCLAILASFGLVSACGITFVDIVGIMPFLILGIGVDNMFILLSGLADTNSAQDVETRIGKTIRTSGIAITITSITDIVAFCAGAASVFPSVRNFSWYTGCAVLFCYINYLTFYTGVMAINESRVTKQLHWFTCCKTKSHEALKAEGKSKMFVLFCGGAARQKREEVEGPIEKYPKVLLKKAVLSGPTRIVIIILFLGYLGVSAWGARNFREDLDLRNLVSSDSYHYKFYDTNLNYFSQSFFVSFYISSEIDYRQESNVLKIESLLKKAKGDKDIGSTFQLSWLNSYINSHEYDNSTKSNFTIGLKSF